MSPAARKQWDEGTLWLVRIVASGAFAVIGYCGVVGVNSFLEVKTNVEILLQQNNGYLEWKVNTDRRVNNIETVVNSHAVDIQNNKIDIREIQIKIK